MVTRADYSKMRVLKWLFFTLTLFCFLLWSAYYSNETGYVLNFDENSEHDVIDTVQINAVGEKDFFNFNKYKKMTTKPNRLHTTTIRPTVKLKGIRYGEYAEADDDVEEEVDKEADFNKRSKKVLKTFNAKLGVGASKILKTDSGNDIVKDPLDAKSEIVLKTISEKTNAVLSRTGSEQIDYISPSQSSTTSTYAKDIKTKQLDNVDPDIINVDDTGIKAELIDKDISPRVKGYQAVQQNRKPPPLQHSNTLDSRLAGNKVNTGSGAKRLSTANDYASRRRSPLFRKRTFDIPIGPSTDYAVPDIHSLRIDKTQNSTFVLLVTYARSGSTWLGEITNQANQSFYVFEPLQKFIVQGYYKENQVCYNNNTCRKPRIFTETYNFALTTFHRLFTCQLTKLHPKAFNVFIKNLKSRHYARTFKSCIVSYGSVMKCLQRLEDICITTKHRVLKTIRISMELVDIMMSLWPNLKVVHLVRDPRGITNSRLSSRTFAMARQLVPHSIDMCNRMLDDIHLDDVLKAKYFDRFRLVFYESLAERPLEGAKFLYEFLEMKLTKDVMKWIYNSTHAQKKTGYYGTMRSDSVKSAYQWRTRLPLFKIRIIDKNCMDVYKILGFMTLTSTEELLDLDIPSRQTLNNPYWFS